MSEKNKNINENGGISNQFKLAMAFNIWHILDRDEYKNSLDYIDKNKWILFTLVMASYQKLIHLKKKSPQEVVSEIAWSTGYMIPENFDLRFCGYDISATRHPQQEKYIITPNILKNSIDIDKVCDDGEHGSVLYELKQLPLSYWFNLKDTIKKYNQKWEEDIRTNLYQWMGFGYQYVLDFYSFINICAYYQTDTSPLQTVWNQYMKPLMQKPLIYIAKDFPEYRSFWESWYNELYNYTYDIFDLARESFEWNTNQMQERKQKLISTHLWADYSPSKSNLSVNKNEICINTENFAEKWLDKAVNSSHPKQEFYGFFTSKQRNRNRQSEMQNPSRPKTDNISIDEIKEIINMTSVNNNADNSQAEIVRPDPAQSAPISVTPSKKISRQQIIQLCCLNGGLLAVNYLFFSKYLIGLTIGANLISSVFGILLIIASLITFGYGNFSILSKKPQLIETTAEPTESTEIQRKNQYIDTLNQSAENPVFRSEINITKEHIEQIQSRLQKINTILSQHFTPNEMTYKKFAGVVEDAATQFYSNVKTMMKRIHLFDTKDYLKISKRNSGLSVSAKNERLKIYTEHINYIKKLVDANENIISKLDGLLLELTKLDDFSEESLNNNPAVNELNDLIEQTKFYKQ